MEQFAIDTDVMEHLELFYSSVINKLRLSDNSIRTPGLVLFIFFW